MTVSKNFILQEFLPDYVYNRFGEKGIWLIDPRIISLAQAIRDFYNRPVIINDWYYGGNQYAPGKTYNHSGYRAPSTRIGATYSQHKFGRAIDIKIRDLHPNTIRHDLRTNFALFSTYGLTTIEKDTPSWVHCDCRYTGLDHLLEVPYRV